MYEKYTITIERSREIAKQAPSQWNIIGKKANGDPEYGYTPIIDNIVTERDTIYQQTLDALDLQAVIMAVNGIPGDE